MAAKTLGIACLIPALALVACGQRTGQDSGGGSSTAPASRGCHGSSSVCFVDIAVTGDSCAFDPDVLKVKFEHKNFIIVWRLPQGYEFRAADDLGFKSPAPPPSEFTDGAATDSPTGGPSGSAAKKHYRIKYVNMIPQKTWKYGVRFYKSGSNTPIQCDPAISNLADG